MEASALEKRKLDGDKAQRIVAAMRASVGARGAAGSTFDVVAREAGVSRGLLHYYFGSKERLLVEVVRRDCDERIAALEHALAGAHSVDEIVQALVASLREFVEGEPGAQAVLYEMVSASRHSEEIRVELAELYRRWRALLAGALREKEREGVV
ncbi:MAG: TetR/AcrR family transcriptional regulator, partial [Thermoleophilaceae bacterium]